ncbi:DUF1667 domain-containing protein [Intestinibacter sp.]
MGAAVSNKIELICIGCPLGCNLTVDMNGSEVVEVSGNNCKKGKEYAVKEVTNPTRIVTSIVRVKNGNIAVVSVKTKEDIPKSKINACVKALKDVEVEAPIKIGDVLVSNVADTGVDIVATRNIYKR